MARFIGSPAIVEELGADAYAHGTLRAGGETLLTVRVDPRTPPGKGEAVHLGIAAEHARVFSPGSGRRICAAR